MVVQNVVVSMYIYTVLHVANQARGLARHTHKLLVYSSYFLYVIADDGYLYRGVAETSIETCSIAHPAVIVYY